MDRPFTIGLREDVPLGNGFTEIMTHIIPMTEFRASLLRSNETRAHRRTTPHQIIGLIQYTNLELREKHGFRIRISMHM